MTYYELIRRCLLEAAERLRISPALTENMVRCVLGSGGNTASRTETWLEKPGKS